ncbi:MAG: ferredoxin [Nitrospiraceae bacterium]
MSRTLRVTVDHNKCVGSTICVLTAPNVFALNDNGQSVVINLAGDTERLILEAAVGCPQSAITVEDVESGERLFPPPQLAIA